MGSTIGPPGSGADCLPKFGYTYDIFMVNRLYAILFNFKEKVCKFAK